MIKKVAISLIVMVLIPFFIYFIVLLPIKCNIGDVNSWLIFYATFCGGILGGLIAYLVSKQQIKDNNIKIKKAKMDIMVNNYNTLVNYLNCVVNELKELNSIILEDYYYILKTEVPFIDGYLLMVNTVQTTQLQYKLIQIFNKISNLKELQNSIFMIMKEKNYVNILYNFKNVNDDKVIKDIEKTIELKANLFLEQSKKIIREVELLNTMDISAEIEN